MVADDEQLYRRVPARAECAREGDGVVHISASAFNDIGRKPSVDRAVLRGHDPSKTKASETDGVAGLIAVTVRGIDRIQRVAPNDRFYRVDVVARPVIADNEEGLPENLAHAQVESDPDMESDSRFRKLKEALARIATWIVVPNLGRP